MFHAPLSRVRYEGKRRGTPFSSLVALLFQASIELAGGPLQTVATSATDTRRVFHFSIREWKDPGDNESSVSRLNCVVVDPRLYSTNLLIFSPQGLSLGNRGKGKRGGNLAQSLWFYNRKIYFPRFDRFLISKKIADLFT